MDKSILREYIDACGLIRETEEDIRWLRKRETVQDKVKGSNPEFPYQAQSFNLFGTIETRMAAVDSKREEGLLLQRRERAQQIKIQVEAWMNTIPLRMQRIIRYRFFEGMNWAAVADKIGGNASADSVRMEYYNFMKK